MSGQLDLDLDILPGDLSVMLLRNSWTYLSLRVSSTVSILKYVENIFVNFAPYPFLPPVIFFSSLL